jgi:hypothetical protein
MYLFLMCDLKSQNSQLHVSNLHATEISVTYNFDCIGTFLSLPLLKQVIVLNDINGKLLHSFFLSHVKFVF